MPPILIQCSCPNEAFAADLARILVEERLAACVQVLPGVVSTYRWNGALQSETEVLLVAKTVRERFDDARRRILDLHPYELPEIIAVDIGAAHAPYLDWIARESGLPDTTC